MGFLTRALGKRITKAVDDFAQTPEGRAALARNDRKMALAETAREIAGSGADDESACARLRERLPDDLEPARDAVEHLGGLRISYLDDRAFRLLSAAVDSTPVRPIDPAVEAQFSAEAQLGRMSLSDGFAYLVSLEPRLGDPQTARAGSGQQRSGSRARRSQPELVGAWAKSPHLILNTDLAASVVREYLAHATASSAPDAVPDPTPFFDRKKRTFRASFMLFGRGDTRPRARN